MAAFQGIRKQLHREQPGQLKRELLWLLAGLKRYRGRILTIGILGLVAAAGALGPIIPPSIIMVVYATITGASVGDMFKAGMGIGIMIVAALALVVLFYARKEQWPKDDIKFDAKEFFSNFIKAVPALMLPIIILGGIYGGIMTGLFGSQSVNPSLVSDGLLFGDTKLFFANLVGTVVTIVLGLVGGAVCIFLTKKITPLRVSEKEEKIGLDITQHGERAYPSFNGLDD